MPRNGWPAESQMPFRVPTVSIENSHLLHTTR